MVVLGLTGSIGMGKSAAATALRRLGVPVHDADATVHRLMRRGGAAVSAIEQAFPDVVVDGAVDRSLLGARVFGNTADLARLESVLHPMVRRAEDKFLRLARGRRERLVVLDIPLLFETGGEARCDAVIVVSAPRFLQEIRVLRRSAMTRERFCAVLSHQMPDRDKRRRTNHIVLTGLDRGYALRQLTRIVALETARNRRYRRSAVNRLHA